MLYIRKYIKRRLFKDQEPGKIKFFFKDNSQRNWVFATSSNFIISISLQPNGAHLWYLKLRLFGLTS